MAKRARSRRRTGRSRPTSLHDLPTLYARAWEAGRRRALSGSLLRRWPRVTTPSLTR